MDTLNVFFEQTRVGSLSINDRRQFSFQYSKKWLTSPDAFQISISLPMQEEIFPHNKVKSFFSNLLPEAAVRILIAKQLGISDKNDFMLLKRIGGECAGAITILPDAGIPESPDQYTYRLLSDEQLADLIKDIPARPLLAGQEGIRISLAGAQEKLALFYNDPSFYIPENGAPSNFILKPNMAHFQFSIENECFCMMLANAVGLAVSPVMIARKQDQKVLLIKRYDRILDNNILKRLHQEDFCQAMGLSHELKYQADGGPGLKACFDLVRSYSANPIKDFQQLMQWVFFNYLIGNMDGHAKNLSFIYQAKQIRLAPFYDMLCTDIYDTLSQKLAMKIGGENRPEWIMERHWKDFAEEIKISHPIFKKKLLDFCLKVTSKIDSTYADFINRYQQNSLLEDITVVIKKRSNRTLKQFNSTKK
ncbi:type II toxin-antitoxin system HipA family toxin [Desulfobacula phenolica]|uniref:Serine/threonine-protein kinase HipA n=2 Tax=Desulfobacula phenolica TaxID=90732 RepID=A0A1H2DQN8_9BACT|nr:type II toxin-antitoxin system HipA family toxin [Desulfobacula phenolica]SDT85061.1 serine/threonine-protein kinase HipA [Desulfobacula phenolica]